MAGFRGVLLAGLLALTATAAEPELEIRILYDNTAASPDFERDWGFSALVDFGGRRILFDSGADAALLLRHLEQLNIDPGTITHALISHHHSDHLNGIYRLAIRNPSMEVYFLDSFPDRVFETAMAVGIAPHRVSAPAEIAPGVFTTGPIDGKIPEQALVVETSDGPVVLVGCAHPGVVKMVETVRRQRGAESIRLLLGGYHMIRQSEEEIGARISRLQELGVVRVAPAHGTGEAARHLFRTAWGANYQAAGAGRRIVLEKATQ